MFRRLARSLRRAVIDPVVRIGPIWRRMPRRHFLMSQHRRLGRRRMSFRRSGFRWTGFPWDEDVTWNMYVAGDYQGPQRQALVRWLRRNDHLRGDRDLVVEVGANIGTTSLRLARDHGCRVLAIEPEPANFDLLRRNVRENGLESRIDCQQAAVAETSGSAEVLIPVGSSGGVELAQPGARSSGNVERKGMRGHARVRTAPLSGLLRERRVEPSSVAVVWCDAQGSDGHVISTAPELWAAGVPLYMELWPDGLRHQGTYEAVAAASSYGFEAFIEQSELIAQDDPEPRPIAELEGLMDAFVGDDQTDVLLIPAHRRGDS